nr:M24 family metallopeptidase [Candidatus Gracilibacteria bacterium]
MSKTYILHQDIDNGYINRNIFYILGFDSSLGTIIFDDKKVILLFDNRYYQLIKNLKYKIKNRFEFLFGKTYEIEIILLDQTFENRLKNIIKGKSVIIEENIPVLFYKNIKKLTQKNIEFTDNIFKQERLIKSKNEIKNIKNAIKIIEKVYKEIYLIKEKLIGKKEYEVRQIIQKLIIELGGEGESFPTIVAFGKNSAIPHHQTGNTKIGNGPLLIDMGVIYKGYCSDFTRTFWIGEKTKNYNEFIKIKNIVKKAHDLGKKFTEKNINITGKELDKVVRNFINEKGYGDYFTHSTGHGVGIQIHEQPWISNKKGDQTLEKGMVFTIEPGIYLPMNFGVRWENIIII